MKGLKITALVFSIVALVVLALNQLFYIPVLKTLTGHEKSVAELIVSVIILFSMNILLDIGSIAFGIISLCMAIPAVVRSEQKKLAITVTCLASIAVIATVTEFALLFIC